MACCIAAFDQRSRMPNGVTLKDRSGLEPTSLDLDETA